MGMVEFRLRNAVHPNAGELLVALFGGKVLQGELVARTSDGQEPFVVVRVRGLDEPVIVPAHQVTMCPADPDEAPCGAGAWRGAVAEAPGCHLAKY